MPLVRIDPPRVKGGAFRRFVGGVQDLIANPVSFGIDVISGSRQPSSSPQFVPFEFDSDSLAVTMLEPRSTPDRGHISPLRRTLAAAQFLDGAAMSDVRAALERTLRSGSIDSALPKAYRSAAAAALAARSSPGEAQWSENMGIGIIPPGGMAGFLQMTPASKLALTGTRGLKRRSKRKKTSAKRSKKSRSATGTKKRKRSSSKRSGKSAKFVKGSAAAKRWMAKLRKMRKK